MRSREPATETSLLFLSRKGCGRSRVHQGQNSGGRHAGHVPTSGGERPTVVLRERKHPRGVFFFLHLPPTTAAATPHASNRVPPSRQSLNRCYPAPLDFPGDVSVAPSARSGWGASARGFDAALALHPSVASGAQEAPCEQRLSEVVASHERLVRSLSPRRSARAAPSPPSRRRVDVLRRRAENRRRRFSATRDQSSAPRAASQPNLSCHVARRARRRR